MISIGQEYKERYEDAERKIAKLQAEIERLKRGQWEPVAWRVKWPDGSVDLHKHEVGAKASLSVYEPLYASQPAPVSVVLPEREEGGPYWSGELDADFDQRLEWAEAKSFNRAIDKVKELNK